MFSSGSCCACHRHRSQTGQLPESCQSTAKDKESCFPCGHASGPKDAMQAYIRTLPQPDACMQLCISKGWGGRSPVTCSYQHYFRAYVAVPNIHAEAGRLSNLLVAQIPRCDNHTNEIIVAGQPCKIVMDFDKDEGFPTKAFPDGPQQFRAEVEAALTSIMAGPPFNVQLAPSSFVWAFTEYTYKPKFSAHLVIHHVMPDGSMLVVPCHKHTNQHGGSRYFLEQLSPAAKGVHPDLQGCPVTQHAWQFGGLGIRQLSGCQAGGREAVDQGQDHRAAGQHRHAA